MPAHLIPDAWSVRADLLPEEFPTMDTKSHAYIVLEKRPSWTDLHGRSLICPDCNDGYQPKDDERVCVMLLTEEDDCDLCGRHLPATAKGGL